MKILIGAAVLLIIFGVEWAIMSTFQRKSMVNSERNALLTTANANALIDEEMWQVKCDSM